MLDALEEFFNFDGTEFVVSKKEYGNYIYSRFALVGKKVVKKTTLPLTIFQLSQTLPDYVPFHQDFQLGESLCFLLFEPITGLFCHPVRQ